MREGDAIKKSGNIIEFPSPAGSAIRGEKEWKKQIAEEAREKAKEAIENKKILNEEEAKSIKSLFNKYIYEGKMPEASMDELESKIYKENTDQGENFKNLEKWHLGALAILRNEENKKQILKELEGTGINDKHWDLLYRFATEIRNKYFKIKEQRKMEEARKKAGQAFASEKNLPEDIAVNE